MEGSAAKHWPIEKSRVLLELIAELRRTVIKRVLNTLHNASQERRKNGRLQVTTIAEALAAAVGVAQSVPISVPPSDAAAAAAAAATASGADAKLGDEDDAATEGADARANYPLLFDVFITLCGVDGSGGYRSHDTQGEMPAGGFLRNSQSFVAFLGFLAKAMGGQDPVDSFEKTMMADASGLAKLGLLKAYGVGLSAPTYKAQKKVFVGHRTESNVAEIIKAIKDGSGGVFWCVAAAVCCFES